MAQTYPRTRPQNIVSIVVLVITRKRVETMSLEACRVAGYEAFRRVDPGVVPARAGAADGVEGDAGDDHPGVAGVGVDRDPLAGPGFAPGLKAGRVKRAFQQAAAVQRVADRAGAVVTGGFEGAVAAAPDVGGGGDRVAGGDHVLDRLRGRGRGARFAFAQHLRFLTRVERGRELAGGRVAAFGGDLFGDRREVVAERRFARLQRVEGFLAFGLFGLQFVETGRSFLAGGGGFALLGGDRVAHFFDLGALLVEPFDRRADLVAQRLHPVDDRVVVFLDLAQVIRLRRHLAPVFGFEDRVRDVRRSRLVDRDEPLAQHPHRPLQLRPHLLQVVFFGFQRRGRPLQLRFLFGQFGLGRFLFLAQGRDFAQLRVDRPVLFGDRRDQVVPLRADPFELVARLFELFLRIGRGGFRPGDRYRAGGGEKQRGEDQKAPRRAHGGAEQHGGAG